MVRQVNTSAPGKKSKRRKKVCRQTFYMIVILLSIPKLLNKILIIHIVSFKLVYNVEVLAKAGLI